MFKKILETESVVNNSKGGLYYSTSFNMNLDLFTLATRYKILVSLYHYLIRLIEKIARLLY